MSHATPKNSTKGLALLAELVACSSLLLVQLAKLVLLSNGGN